MDLTKRFQIPRRDRALHHRGPRVPVSPLGRAIPRGPQRELRVELEEVREAGGELRRAEECERVRIATPREGLQMLPERPLVVLELLEAEDV